MTVASVPAWARRAISELWPRIDEIVDKVETLQRDQVLAGPREISLLDCLSKCEVPFSWNVEAAVFVPSQETPQLLPEPPPPLQPQAPEPGHQPVLHPMQQQPPQHATQQLLPQPPQYPAAAVFSEKAAEQQPSEVQAVPGQQRSFAASPDAGRAQQLHESESKARELTKQLEQRLDKAEEMRLAAGNRIAEVESELENLKTAKPDQIASKPDLDTRTADAERWSAASRVAELAAQVQPQQEEVKTIGRDTAPSGATVHDPEAVDWEAFYGGLGGLHLQRLEEAVDWEAFYGDLGGVYLRRLDGPLVGHSPQSKGDVLVFSDAYGVCTEIGELVPPGCVGIWNVQRQAADKYTEKGVKHLVGMRPWDLIIFALGVDPPRSRHGVYFREHQADVVKAFAMVLRAIRGDAGRGKRLAVLTVECFNEEPDFHKDSCFCDSPLFFECYGETGVLCPIKFIDTEWERSPENLEHIRDELFRLEPFGLDVVRILNEGCFRLRHRGSSEAGLEEGSEPESEYEETGSEEESEEEESEEEEERAPEADLAFAAEQWAKECKYEGDMEFEALHD